MTHKEFYALCREDRTLAVLARYRARQRRIASLWRKGQSAQASRHQLKALKTNASALIEESTIAMKKVREYRHLIGEEKD